MIGFFSLICVSFAWITFLAIVGALYCAWRALSTKTPIAKVERYSDGVYQCVHVAQWTLIAAGVSGMVWQALEFGQRYIFAG